MAVILTGYSTPLATAPVIFDGSAAVGLEL